MAHCGIRSEDSCHMENKEDINYKLKFSGHKIAIFKPAISPVNLPVEDREEAADLYSSNDSTISLREAKAVTSRQTLGNTSLNGSVRDASPKLKSVDSEGKGVDTKLKNVSHKIMDGSPISKIERLVLKSCLTKELQEITLKKIQEILNSNSGVTINDPLIWDWHNITPLMGATANGISQNCINIMDKFDADPFILDEAKKHMLHLIIAKGHNGIEQPSGKREDQFMLFLRVLKHPDIRKFIDSQDVCGLTPLHYACARRDADYIKALIAAGANPYILDENKNNCFSVLKLAENTRVNIIGLALSGNLLDSETAHILDKDKRSLNSSYLPANDSHCFWIYCANGNHEFVGVMAESEDEMPEGLQGYCTVKSRSSFNQETEIIEELMKKSMHEVES